MTVPRNYAGYLYLCLLTQCSAAVAVGGCSAVGCCLQLLRKEGGGILMLLLLLQRCWDTNWFVVVVVVVLEIIFVVWKFKEYLTHIPT